MAEQPRIIDVAPLTALPCFDRLDDFLDVLDRRRSSRIPCGRFHDGAVGYLGYQLDWFLSTGELALYTSPEGAGVVLMQEKGLWSPAGQAAQELDPENSSHVSRAVDLNLWLPEWEWLGHGLDIDFSALTGPRGGPRVEFISSSQLLYS
jgi:hypothetical protein